VTGQARTAGWVIGLTALVVALALAATAAPAKPKKKKGGGAVDITKSVNAPIPDAISAPPGSDIEGSLLSTIDVGKRLKGRQIRDVDVTVRTLGASGTIPARHLRLELTAPNGATTVLFRELAGPQGAPNPSIGPLKLDDQARLQLGGEGPDTPFRLFTPWAGTAEPLAPLAQMNGGPVRGTWTLVAIDEEPGETSNLVSWRLEVVAGKPYRTK
jgi:hypothetical protein